MGSPALRASGSVLSGVAVIALHASLYGAWVVDDAAITFAYARSIATGDGPVLQPGSTPVEAYSNPTWLVLLALGRLVGLFDHGTLFGVSDQVMYPKLLALLCCAGILLACYRAASAVTRRPALVTLVAGVTLATIPSFVIWCFSGLENSLFALAVAWLGAVLCRAAVDDRLSSPKVAVVAGLLAALAALTRPDGVVYVAAFPVLAVLWLRFGRAAWLSALSAAAFAVPYGAYLVFRLVTFGELLSGPAIAKGQTLPDADQLMRAGELVGYAGALLVLVLAVCVGIVLSHPSRLRAGMIALLVPLGLAIVAHAVLLPDWMGEQRFSTPIWPLGTLIGTLAVGAVLPRLAPRGRGVLVAGLAVALGTSLLTFRAAAEDFRAAPTVPMCVVAERYGAVFNHYATLLGVRHGTVLLPDIGGAALAGRLRIADLAGLADYEIADFRGNADDEGLRDHVFDELKPTFIHTHQGWAAGIPNDPRLSRDYVRLFEGEPLEGDWVRRDVVADDPSALAATSKYAAHMVPAVMVRAKADPRRDCTTTYPR
ncbi:hypothetical protein [Actinophytocola oryzae]|uniref:Glycosyltransferase RgtA/B/C/D-like domain-containing protein n=1 Tax=Actinophytocola oryzae TaxID=502181 RepID=A0A4R7VNG7_9PSEU|nr:hypothetical protein [Actinophytocola oryzae]TDV51114.1 hypothetical protein CLV71_106468 [Actinophytocola oryzae]